MSKFNEPVHDFLDGFYIIRGTEYYKPLDAKEIEGFKTCVCGWGDTKETVQTKLGTFIFCRTRHGEDYEAFAEKYLQDMKILQEYEKQLTLF